MSDKETKDALKEAMKEWLDEKFASFGKWSLTAMAAVALSWVIYGLISVNGFHK